MSLQQESHAPDFAMVTLAFEGGGPERDAIFLCNALAAKGMQVALVVLRGEGPLRVFVDPSVQIIVVGERRIRYAFPLLRRTLRSLAPSVVLSSGVPSLNLLTLLAARVLPRDARPKVVLRENSVPSMARRDPSRSNRIAYRLLRRLYRFADRIITLTDGAREDLIRLFSVPRAMVSVMRTNAVLSPAIIDRISRWDGESGREAGLIVWVGRLSAEKDPHTLLRAVSMLPPNRPWRLAMIGDGPLRTGLEVFCHSNRIADRVTFTGYVTDPIGWMMRANVLVLSSLYEGFGNVIIEALACGTSVVCTDCPYGPQEILRGGRYGSLTPVGDSARLAAAIEAALDEFPERKALMQHGLEYTADRAAAQFLEIIGDLELKPTSPVRSVIAGPETARPDDTAVAHPYQKANRQTSADKAAGDAQQRTARQLYV
jgi:glycosyltransferase involved in cell wall biosynthesis